MFFGRLLLGIGLLSLCCAALGGEKGLLLRATFDNSFDADLAKGDWKGAVSGDASLTGVAKYGKALRLPERSRISYSMLNGNFNPAAGTICFWIRPDWDAAGGVGKPILTAYTADREEYIVVNIYDTLRLGVSMRGGVKDWVWRRADADISKWKAGEWHHIALAWDDGKLRFFVDGRVADRKSDDAKTLTKPPQAITLQGCDAIIDDLRVYDRMLSEDELKAVMKPAPLPFAPLSTVAAIEARGRIGINRRLRVDGMRMPLVINGVAYGKGFGVTAPARLKIGLPDGFRRLVGMVAVDEFSDEEAAASIEILADGKRVFSVEGLRKKGGAKKFDIPIEGIGQIELIASNTRQDSPAALVDWLCLYLVRDKDSVVPQLCRRLSEKEIEMYRKRRYAYHFTFEPPKTDEAYLLARKNWIDEIDVSVQPPSLGKQFSLRTFATPNEYEPLCFVIYAMRDLNDVNVTASDLTSDEGTLPSSCVDIRMVKRGLYRRLYTRPPWESDVISRFLVKELPFDMERHTLREIHLTVHVPEDARAGIYRGTITVSAANAPAKKLPVEIEVLPFKLRPLTRKVYGIYYRLGRALESPERLALELRDLREHGLTIMYPGISIRYEKEDDHIKIDYSEVRAGLEALRKFGFKGPIPIRTGFPSLARVMGRSLAPDNLTSLDSDEEFQSTARRALEGLLELQKDFPEFEIVATHMDEVLGRDRLSRYIHLTRAVRQIKDLRVYITLHNRPSPIVEEMTRQLDPYVDIRCYNGHSMDEWLKAGHTFDELAQQLKASGDEAWIYYNIRGSFFIAKWMRIVNGLYMWLGPFKAHCPWMYYYYSGDPFDDTDGPTIRGHDFAYAVPDPRDGKTPVPTRHWEAYREGVDDMRYIAMLEELIAEKKASAPQLAQEAQKWLDSIRRAIPFDEMKNIEEESPLLIAISRKFSGDDLQRLRYTTAQHIIKLLNAK